MTKSKLQKAIEHVCLVENAEFLGCQLGYYCFKGIDDGVTYRLNKEDLLILVK